MEHYNTLPLWLLILPVVATNPFKEFIDHFFCGLSCDFKSAFNARGLEADLKNKVFGQHIASEVVLRAVNDFMKDRTPPKPLVLSFHGMTGTGKSLVTKIIAKNLFTKGMNSKQVHLFISDLHFSNKTDTETHKAQLQQWIRGNVSVCPHSMFIFDDMDTMNPELADSLRANMDQYDNIDGVSYRHAIFILLSNAGGGIINQVALEFWREGRPREEIQLNSQNLEAEISKDAFNCKNSGFWKSRLIDRNIVDFFIPFLPLEYRHVRSCVLAEMAALGLPPKRRSLTK